MNMLKNCSAFGNSDVGNPPNPSLVCNLSYNFCQLILFCNEEHGKALPIRTYISLDCYVVIASQYIK